MIDVAELMLDTDFVQPYEIERLMPGSYINEGEWVEGLPEVLPRLGSIQPAKSEDKVEFLPEGERGQEMKRIWDAEEIFLADGKGRQSDIILFNGNRYRVIGLRAWGQNGYWEAMAVRFK